MPASEPIAIEGGIVREAGWPSPWRLSAVTAVEALPEADLKLFGSAEADILPASKLARDAHAAFKERQAGGADEAQRALLRLMHLAGFQADRLAENSGEGGFAGQAGLLAARGLANFSAYDSIAPDRRIGEFLGAAAGGAPFAGGLAWIGGLDGLPLPAPLHFILVEAANAADAGVLAAEMALATSVSLADAGKAVPVEGPVGAVLGTPLALLTPPASLEAEAIWDALSAAARVASAARQAGRLRRAVLTLNGRGRIIGSLDGNRLLRFGVSEWR